MPTIRCALYVRVSTLDQHTDNQILELRQYCAARNWTITREYTDHGISGTTERRPGLDELIRDAKRRRFDVLICWRLDRLGRNLRHLVTLIEELQGVGVSFVSLNEGIDLGTPAGRLQMHMLAALSEFERGRIQERVRAGLARARANGRRLGRPGHRLRAVDLARTANLSIRVAAKTLSVSPALIHKLRRSQNPADFRLQDTAENRGSASVSAPVHHPSVL